MAKIAETIINCAVYEDATELMGMADCTLPEINNLTQEISGAGIAGNVESIIMGHLEAMSMTINFRTVTDSQVKLAEPRVHDIDLRVAQQQTDTSTGKISTVPVKHILKVIPKKTAPGNVAPASTADANGEYAVHYYAQYISGKKKIEIDPLNFIYYVNGKDYLKEVRKALGK
jgi:hypothetical protein